MSDLAIRVENLSKRYHIGPRERYKPLRDVITDAVVSPFRRLRSKLALSKVEGFQRSDVETFQR